MTTELEHLRAQNAALKAALESIVVFRNEIKDAKLGRLLYAVAQARIILNSMKETQPMQEKPASVAAKAKTVKLSAAQMKLAIKVDCNGTLRISNYGREHRTAAAMVKKGLLEVTETGSVWDAYYGLTDAGYDAMGND